MIMKFSFACLFLLIAAHGACQGKSVIPRPLLLGVKLIITCSCRGVKSDLHGHIERFTMFGAFLSPICDLYMCIRSILI